MPCSKKPAKALLMSFNELLLAGESHRVTLDEEDISWKSLQYSWDAYVAPNTPIDALAMPKIKRFIAQVNNSGRFALDDETPLAALEKLKYIVNGQPTWAALLLFAKEPLRHHVHIDRFKTPSMILDDRQFTDTLFEVVEQSMQFIVTHISVAFEFDGSVQRKERFAYPLPALREALLNAVVHRSYTNSNDIQIKIFDDSIAIYSPGAFYGEISNADLQTDNYKSCLRNKLIAEAFYLTNNIEKYGSGFIRIRKALRDYPEVSFEVKEIGAGVELTFKRLAADADEPQQTNEFEKISVESTVEILNLIARKPSVTAKELAQTVGVTLRAIEKQIAKLKREGRLIRVGPNKGGHWQVQKVDK
jgi:ATP-dependent DNA helicase RecG